MSLKLVTPPANEPISLVEAKAHLREDSSDQDDLIAIFIKAARQHAEKFLGRALIAQTWDLYLDAFPTEDDLGWIEIPLPPLIGVDGVFYVDGNGDEQEFSVASYNVVGTHGRDNVRARVELTSSGAWPTTSDTTNAVRIRFTAGYQDTSVSPVEDAVDDDIRAAILLILGSFYANREQVVIGQTATVLPWGAVELMKMRRVDLSMA